MNLNRPIPQETFHPRMIVWQLTNASETNTFSTHECLLTIDSIARIAKPIVILTGNNLIQRSDLYEIVEYGSALGLKIIIEALPDELSSDVLKQYARFGAKVFRILIDGCIKEDPGTRFKHSGEFQGLRDAVRRLRKAKYEIHLCLTITYNDIRALAFNHDYAIRSAAEGLYCYLRPKGFNNNGIQEGEDPSEEIIEAIAKMKRFSPESMYVSPQCVKYGMRRISEVIEYEDGQEIREYNIERKNWCLGGKTFTFISSVGKVQVCAGQLRECGDLRVSGYDFQKIWETSEVFESLRGNEKTCTEIQGLLDDVRKVQFVPMKP
jgi:hypothetical protein